MLGARQPEALRELPPEFLQPGDLVNGWRVVKKLGEGGCGCVFLVEQGEQRLAMKFTKARATHGDAAQLETRGLREVAYMLLAEHPHIMKVWGFGRAPDARTGWLYALLDYVEGDTLSSWARRNSPTPREVVRLFAKVASALEAAHQQGLFHRDVKPSNILVRAADGEPVVADWGAGRYATAGELTEGLLPPGTARYRAPEARRFERENEGKPGARYEFKPQDDLYAAGATLYEVLTSRQVPESGPRLRNLPPAHEVNSHVPPALGDVVRKLMALEPRHRHATAEALRRDLERLATQQGPEWDVPLSEAGANRDAASSVPPRPVPRPRWRLGALLLAGVALLAMVAAPWLGEGSNSRSAVASTHSGSLLPPPSPAITAISPSALSEPFSMLSPYSTKESTPLPSTTARHDRTASEPKKSAPDMRKALAVSTLCALGSGCAGAQVRPEPGECPRTAINAMRDELGLGLPAGLSLAIDVHQKGDAYEYAPGVYREGPITGLVVRGREKLVEGTTLKGRLWLAKGDADSPLGYVVGRYTEAQLPDGRHLPVCIVLADPTAQPGFPIREGAGDGVALTLRWGPATAVSRWP